MTGLIETHLPIQIIAVLLSTFAFLIIMEAFGYIALRCISLALKRFDKVETNNFGLSLRVFIGGLAYTLIFLAIGAVGVLTKTSVLLVSCLVPILAFIAARRWRELRWSRVKLVLQDNKYTALGGLSFLVLTFILWFRPITNFDGLWYHLEIPKLFLQNHSVKNQGGLILYSLQPSMDYFWNLWPLSLPVSTAVAGIMVNSIQASMVAVALVFASKVGKKVWGWGKFYQYIVPLVLGASFETMSILGGGGNDLLGLSYGLVAALYAFYLLKKREVSWYELTLALLLIVGFATVKVFFTIYAALVLVYLLIGVWNKLSYAHAVRKQLIRLAFLLLAVFAITYLPWIIRSEMATGRLLDPVGTPGFNALFYYNQGGGTALNHWTNYVFTRFYDSLGPMLFFVYSPLVLVGVLSIYNKAVRKRAANLWVLASVGLISVFFASITLDWRYYLPQITVLMFLGVVTLMHVMDDFDLFGRLAIWAVILLVAITSFVRVLFTLPDVSGFPSINHDIYVSHFTTINAYLDRKLSTAYDYVQQTSPSGLSPNEKIFIGNTYQPIPLLKQPINNYELANIHNLAYVNNPILEPTMDEKDIQQIKNLGDFTALLRTNHIRYIVTRKNIGQVCSFLGVKDYTSCNNPKIFKPVLYDPQWKVSWYKLVAN
jgi:hypothetical protein